MLHQLMPLIYGWKRHRFLVALFLIQASLSVAVLSIVVSNIQSRSWGSLLQSGIPDEQHTLAIQILQSSGLDPSLPNRIQAELKALPETRGAAVIASAPFSGSLWSSNVSTTADLRSGASPLASLAVVGPGALNVLGVKISAGQDFEPHHYADLAAGKTPSVAIITESLSEKLFRGMSPIGQLVYREGKAVSIIGVAAAFASAAPDSFDTAGDVLFLPVLPESMSIFGGYTIVAVLTGAATPELAVSARELIAKLERRLAIVDISTIASLRERYFARNIDAVSYLRAVVIGVTLAALFGMYTLTTVWVLKRARSFGICRAIGATPSSVVLALLGESTILSACSGFLGAAEATAAQFVFLRKGGLSPLEPRLVLTVVVSMILINLLATVPSARKILKVPPTEAIRART